MTTSIKELSIAEPELHPTLIDLPSVTSIVLTVDQVDEKMGTMTPDVYSMCKTATQIKQSLLHLQCKLEHYRGYGIRLMGLIKCIIEHFGVNCYYYSRLIPCIRTCNAKWKKLLFKAIKVLKSNTIPQQIFVFRAERNTYLLSMLRSYNINIGKLLEKLISRNLLNPKTKKYVKSNGLQRSYKYAWDKMMIILEQKEDQTYLKIYLIQQFIKYLLNYIHLCLTEQEEKQVFANFYTASLSLCRIIKKFYHNRYSQIIKDSLKVVETGFQAYVQIFQKRSGYMLKIEQAQLILHLLKGKTVNFPKTQNKDAFVIRLLIKILFNWRQIRQRSQKTKTFTYESQHQYQRSFSKRHISKPDKESVQKPQTLQTKLELLKINKSLSNLNKRRSLSSSKDREGQTFHPSSKVKLRSEIQSYAKNYIKRPQSLHLPSSCNREQKKQKRKKNFNDEERQMKLQDYALLLNNSIKAVPTISKIQLYQPDKMKNFYRSKPKPKLRLV